MVKNTNYELVPFVQDKDTTLYGEKIEFKSNLHVDVIVEDIQPYEGFIGDTINIIGKDFCKSVAGENGSNTFFLGNTQKINLFV